MSDVSREQEMVLQELILRLDDRHRRLFAADCIERLLPYFEAKFPIDKRPHKAIRCLRDFLNGKATAQELGYLHDQVFGAAYGYENSGKSAVRVANAVIWSCVAATAHKPTFTHDWHEIALQSKLGQYAKDVTVLAAYQSATLCHRARGLIDGESALFEEYQWQLQCIHCYLDGEIQE